MTFNHRVSTYAGALTKSELSLVSQIQADYPQALLDTATSLAKRVGTSASTVVRLLAKLGYDSYSEAQREARSELAAFLAVPAARVQAVLPESGSVRGSLDNALAHDQHNLTATYASLDIATMEAVVRLLSQRKHRIHVYGEHLAAPLASHLALYLNMCTPQVRLIGASHAMAVEDQMLWIDKHDVLLAPTFRRHSVAVAHAARYFRSKGATVILITDSPAAPAVASADHCILVRTGSASPFDSYTAAFSVANALIAAVAQRSKVALNDALERGEALWEMRWAMKGADPSS